MIRSEHFFLHLMKFLVNILTAVNKAFIQRKIFWPVWSSLSFFLSIYKQLNNQQQEIIYKSSDHVNHQLKRLLLLP